MEKRKKTHILNNNQMRNIRVKKKYKFFKKRQLNFVLISILLCFGSGLEFGSVDLDLDPSKWPTKEEKKLKKHSMFWFVWNFWKISSEKCYKNFVIKTWNWIWIQIGNPDSPESLNSTKFNFLNAFKNNL